MTRKRTRRVDKRRLYEIDNLTWEPNKYAPTLEEACRIADENIKRTGHSILISWAETGEIVASRTWIPQGVLYPTWYKGVIRLLDGVYTPWKFYDRHITNQVMKP